ncbi:MAG: hypothetical protein QOD77_1527 [Thermoplasmata archaeon]|jgi:hypothetical protein|nr:hypothetical protein [Thermoplasmata archaeon]
MTMVFSPRLRKAALVAHVAASLGWLGSVAAFLALALAGLEGKAVYAAMDVVGWSAIVPFCFAALGTGVVLSLGTEWGLFRHYWVIVKLGITVVATAFLLLHLQPVSHLAELAADHPFTADDHHGTRLQLVFDAAGAIVLMLVATVLSVFKPRGMTRHGRRKLAP